ncbi:MAG TPA: DUF732 domain-containing protein [Mycobacterium sp.]|nr:DUF732 domain-containing protein [Mycobacterium sp.]HTX97318.1 DUF732 domain-containing protein [Mycobacterium sp.]
MKNAARLPGPIAVVLVGIGLFAAAPAANADPADDNYLRALHQRGLSWPNGSDQMMINVGHAVCQDWAAGDTMAQTVDDVQKSLGLSTNGAGSVIGAATAAYCPEFRSKI